VAEVRRAVAAVDTTIPLYNVVPMRSYLDVATEAPRLSSTLLTGFAGLALVLAIVGVYGMLTYIVALRTREIGVRIALGAGKGDILRSVIGQGLVLTAIGLTTGLLLAVAASRLLESQLYEVSPTDAVVYVGAAALLAIVAAIASAVPARRASSVDPLLALRDG
jgi:putative ABC transport system permease protein